jgi:hypothetical protein
VISRGDHSPDIALRVRGRGHLGQGLFQAGEARDELVQPGQAEDTENRTISGSDQPQPAALGQGPLMSPDKRIEPQ